jgi:hypothetical protein
MLRLRLLGMHLGLLLAGVVVATLGGACGSSANPSSPDAGDASVIDGPSSDAPSTSSDAAEASTGCPPSPVVYDAGAPITVHGTVYSQGGGAAVVQVTIQGKTSTTAGDGTFSIAGVTPPYDVVMDDLTFNNHTAYLGLTRSDPSLLANALPVASAKYAQQVSGSVTVGGAVVDAGASQLVGAAMDLVSGSDEHVGGELQSTFLLGGGWSAGPLATATLEGFTANLLPTGGPQAFTAQGTQVLTLDGGATITGVDIAVSPGGLSATTLSGTLTLPSGNVNPTIALSLGHGGQTAVTLPADALGGRAGGPGRQRAPRSDHPHDQDARHPPDRRQRRPRVRGFLVEPHARSGLRLPRLRRGSGRRCRGAGLPRGHGWIGDAHALDAGPGKQQLDGRRDPGRGHDRRRGCELRRGNDHQRHDQQRRVGERAVLHARPGPVRDAVDSDREGRGDGRAGARRGV